MNAKFSAGIAQCISHLLRFEQNAELRRMHGVGLLFTLLWLFIAPPAFAQQFTANSLGDYGNVTVMEVTGDYDAENPDGTVNVISRQEIAKEFYKTHKDEYDFLVIFTNYDFKMLEKEVAAFYTGVKNDTQGLGLEAFNNTELYGSNGNLQGTIDMGNLAKISASPLDPEFKETISVLSHEIMHRWAAHVKYRDGNGADSSALLGIDGSHWSFLLDSGGSLMYGNRWQDNGNGTFTSLSPQSEMKVYSPLELYLMGMIDKSRVPPMLLIDSPGMDSNRLPEAGITITGAARYVTIDQIIAAVGPRTPDAALSQKHFKTAFIFVTQPGTLAGDDLYKIENVRNGAVTRFSILTDGAALMQVASTVKENVPANSGVIPPPVTPRTLPPDINEGVSWLLSNQRVDGSWMDRTQTPERDTAVTTAALKTVNAPPTNYQAGLQWLGSVSSNNLDYLAKKIEALVGAGQDIAPLMKGVLAQQNMDGGWGSGPDYGSSNADTALALRALSLAGYSDQSALSKAIEYLKSKQNQDGGWSGADQASMVWETSAVLSSLNGYRAQYQLESSIMNGSAWLISRQNLDGGFGNSPSTVYDTAMATLALRELNASTDITNKSLAYLLGRQDQNGSWDQSSYETALAVSAVFKATVDPDLSIKPENISIIPAKITSLPVNIVIKADVWNLGRTAAQAAVALYDGVPSAGNKLGEQTLVFPGQASTTVTFAASFIDGSEHRFTIVVDPGNRIKESNKLNNAAVKALSPDATYDLEVLSSDIAVSANPASFLQDVTITSKITNKGKMNAYSVQVRYFIDDPGAPFEIATQTIDIPSGATVTNQTTWRASKSGTNMPLTAMVDPFNNFMELSKANNKASVAISVNEDARPNLAVS